ncbi:MAG: hypothetical protein Q9191_005162 [Dirinaria sp. TL-2023a]
MVLVFLFLHIPDRENTKIAIKEKLRQLNSIGLLFLVPGVVCLCLALQWGGVTYAWSEGRIVALLVLTFVLLIAFVLVQVWKPDEATIPPRIFMQRSIASGFWVSSCIGAHQMVFIYFLPVWFQAIKGDSAVKSGIHLLPMVLPVVVASIITGILVSRIGYYTPFMIVGVCITAIGAGLLNALEVNTSEGKWIGYQIMYGFGMGLCFQAPNMAAQTVLTREDVSIGASLMFFGQLLLGSVFISVGQNLLDNQLAKRLASIPGITGHLISNTGATTLLDFIPPNDHAMALQAYNDSLRVCFRVALIMACITILGAVGMEWRSVKTDLPPKNPDSEQATTTEGSERQISSSEKEMPEAEEAEGVSVEKDQEDRDSATAARLRTSTDSHTRTASPTDITHMPPLVRAMRTEERIQTEKAEEAREMSV